jgi:glycosyltransferase involved in cell wall biosynthesis
MIPLLVVRVLTYNHENYIRKCLEGVVAQKTNFPFKVIIGEDCSTDNTATICKEFEKSYPSLIELHCNAINNLQLNSTNNWNLCIKSGARYIALLEGDDYWTDPLKLQKQVDFLETHREYVICFHSLKILEPDGTLCADYITRVPAGDTDLYDLLLFGNYIHTPSVVFRSDASIPFSAASAVKLFDFFLYFSLATKGRIKQLPYIMAVYRNRTGIHSTATTETQIMNTIQTLEYMHETTGDFRIKRIIELRIKAFHLMLKETSEKQNYLADVLAGNIPFWLLLKVMVRKASRTLAKAVKT